LNSGESAAIVGKSGAGKTTLMQVLGTLDTPDSGTVLINGADVTSFSEKKLSRFRNRHIGFVFQFHHLLPEFTALENVCIPGWIGNRSKEEVEIKAIELLKLLDINHRSDHKPGKLSGGEQQRVAIARALINNPDLVFADEPTGNLDSENTEVIAELFTRLKNELNQSFVIVTHNQEFAEIGDVQWHMKDGVIINNP
jgi:lipoprotein-releasing system ATP-binding protein